MSIGTAFFLGNLYQGISGQSPIVPVFPDALS
jgi:hypothetical protein